MGPRIEGSGSAIKSWFSGLFCAIWEPVQDPVARAMSAYNMDRGRFCEDDGSTSSRAPFLIPESVCPDTGFFDTVQQFVDAEDGGADDICTFTGQVRCSRNL